MLMLLRLLLMAAAFAKRLMGLNWVTTPLRNTWLWTLLMMTAAQQMKQKLLMLREQWKLWNTQYSLAMTFLLKLDLC
ncbi:hypothetical protein BDR26DRAFT_874704 [Obelidium mucronatum]|nr:hypothetical protein BDR26DRAFT_874704 [Obelidium mucronatum]